MIRSYSNKSAGKARFRLRGYSPAKPQAGDASFSSVALLCNFNGADKTTNFVDHSLNEMRLRSYGSGCNLSTTQKQFGVSSLYTSGMGYVGTYSATDLMTLPAGDFTIEFWMYLVSKENNGGIICNMGSSSGWSITMDAATNNVVFNYYAASVKSRLVSSNVIYPSQWVHIAVVRSSGVIKMYIGGAPSTTTVNNTEAQGASDALFLIGVDSTYSLTSTMYVDSIRITKGVARYTALFTPPTEEFSAY